MPKRGFEKISKEEILTALRRYAAKRGDTVTMRDFSRKLGISPSTLVERWGGGGSCGRRRD